MPAVVEGLGVGERVLRRHVARLETVQWLERAAALRGDGSLVWLTAAGLDGVGLDLAPVRAPARFSAATHHSVQVGWVAARLERQGLRWRSARELAVDGERWEIAVANERGGQSHRLPDLVLSPADNSVPVAIVLHRWQQSVRRQRADLEGWRAAIKAGRYAQVRYQTGEGLVTGLHRLAAQVGLEAPQFVAGEGVTAPALTIPTAETWNAAAPAAPTQTNPAPLCPAAPPGLDPDPLPPALPVAQKEVAMSADERQRLLDELRGLTARQPRRLWRRRHA